MTPANRTASPCAWVSFESLRHNLAVVRSHLSPGTWLCAVLKADAYGHGAPGIARELAGVGARRRPLVDAVAVATFDEAEWLGRVSVPVYVLRPVENIYVGRERQRLEAAVRAGWVLSLNSAGAAGDVARVAESVGLPALVQIVVDTGMARAGAPPEQVPAVLAAVRARPSLRLVAVSTHFVASEDASNPLTAEQLSTFRRVADPLLSDRPTLVRHAANSGGVFFHPDAHLDMVRPGKALYGIDPAGGQGAAAARGLRPILRWTAPLLMVRDLRAGSTVGYGATFTAPRDMRLGLVPIGFADGYPRSLSNRGVMLVGGHPAPVVGRVSMDYATIDLTNVPHPTVGDEVTVLDDDPRSPAGAYALARLADTIPSELFCRIGARIPRVPVGQEVPTEEEAAALARGGARRSA